MIMVSWGCVGFNLKFKVHSFLYFFFFSLAELQEIAQLLNLDESILLNCLIKSGPIWNQLELDTGSELDALKASRIRYILCRTLYGRLFTWVVNRINESLKVSNRGWTLILVFIDSFFLFTSSLSTIVVVKI
jgi:myosin heavy subunit